MGWAGTGAADRGINKAAPTAATRSANLPQSNSSRSGSTGTYGGRSAGSGEAGARPGLRTGTVQQWQQGQKDSPGLGGPSKGQAAGEDETWDHMRIPEGSQEGDEDSQGEAEEGGEDAVDFSAIFSQKRADRRQGRPVGMVPAFGRPLSQPQPQPQSQLQPQEESQGQEAAREASEGGSQPQERGQARGQWAHEAQATGLRAAEKHAGAQPAQEIGRVSRSCQAEASRPGALGAVTGAPPAARQDSTRPPLHPSVTPARGAGAGGRHNVTASAAKARAVAREGEAGGTEQVQRTLPPASPRTLKLRNISQHIQPSSPLFSRAAQSSAYIQVQRSSSVTSSSRPPHAPARAPLPPSRLRSRPGDSQQQENQLAVRGTRASQQHGIPVATPWGDLPALGQGLQAFVRRATGERERGRNAPEGQCKGGHRPGVQSKAGHRPAGQCKGGRRPEGQCKGGHRPGGETKETPKPVPEPGTGVAVPSAASPEGHPDYSLLFSQAREERRKGRVSPILPCALQPGTSEGAP